MLSCPWLAVTGPSDLLTHCSRKRARLAGLLRNQVKLRGVSLAAAGQRTLTQPALLPALGDVISSSAPAKGLRAGHRDLPASALHASV